MTPNDRLGDRRSELRFEIIGDLWATLVTRQSLLVLNLGLGGMLVECPGPLAVGSQQRLRLSVGDEESDLAASVRHVTPAPGKPDRYFIGLAFSDLSAAMRDRIGTLIGQGRQGTGRVEEA